MAGLFRHKKPTGSDENKIGAVRIQNSCQGAPIPLVYGTTRITPNLLWYGDFTAVPHTETTQTGGKGGGGAANSNTTYTYTVGVVLGLMERAGLSEDGFIGAVWKTKDITTPEKIGLTQFRGLQTDAWTFLTTSHANEALQYRGIAYTAHAALDLGSSDSLPNMSFEVSATGSGADNDGGYENQVIPATVLLDLLTDERYGAGWSYGALDFAGIFGSESTGDHVSWRAYCEATNFLVSPAYVAQRPLADMLEELARVGNAAIVWSDGILKVIPYADAVINRGIVRGLDYGDWTPDLTVQYDLTDDDFLASAGEDPVKITRKRQSDAHNHVQLEVLDRDNAYNTHIAEAKDQADIELNGLRSLDVIEAHLITDIDIGRAVAQTILQRELYIRNSYEFKLGWRYARLEPMDIVSLTEERLALDALSVRITQVEEDEDGALTITAEDLFVGISTPGIYASEAQVGAQPNNDGDPGDATGYVAFQPPLALSGGVAQAWIGASGGLAWGGAQLWVSTNGGSSYGKVGELSGPARWGELTACFPSHADPDTVNTLAVDLGDSRGTLTSAESADADAFTTLCFVGTGGAGEIVAYSAATLTGSHQYDLDTYIRRGLYTSNASSHASGVSFLRLDGAIGKYDIPDSLVGGTLLFKLLSFNRTGGGLQLLEDVSPYSYTVLTPA